MSHPEGLTIALARIAEEKERRSGFLDLGRLGLTEWPEGLWELGHLKALNFGKGIRWQGEWREATGRIAANHLSPQTARWPALFGLLTLSVSGNYDEIAAFPDQAGKYFSSVSVSGVNNFGASLHPHGWVMVTRSRR